MAQGVTMAVQGAAFAKNVAVTHAAAVALTTSSGRTMDRKNISIFNNGPNNIYIGFKSTVGTADGFPVPPQTQWSMDLSSKVTVYAIADTADQVSPADTRVTEAF